MEYDHAVTMRRLSATTCFVYLKPTFDRALCARGCGLLISWFMLNMGIIVDVGQ